MTALFPWQGDRPQALVGARSPSKAKIRLPILSPWPSSTVFQAKAKAKKKKLLAAWFPESLENSLSNPGESKNSVEQTPTPLCFFSRFGVCYGWPTVGSFRVLLFCLS
jgi:hypothetical protein